MSDPIELEAEREPDAWQPVGLLEAAKAAHDESEAEAGAPGEVGAETAPAPIPWDGMVGMLLDVVFGRLAEKDKGWALLPSERSALVRAWSDYLATVAMAPGPLAGALLATGVIVGPKAVEVQRRRRKERTVDVEARDPEA